jgi:deoxyribodipyrimidine photolyase-related protein
MLFLITEATYVPHPPKKIAFLFTAMRHFAETLQEQGFKVRYITLDDPANTGSFNGEIARFGRGDRSLYPPPQLEPIVPD